LMQGVPNMPLKQLQSDPVKIIEYVPDHVF
jgi:hypothetical protein